MRPMSALPSKADMCGATRYVCFGPIADMEGLQEHSDECRSARQDNPDFGEGTRLCFDLDYTPVLFHDDIVTDREAKASAFSRRFSREERVEHLFLHVGRHTGAVVADSDFNTIPQSFGRCREGRLVIAAVCLRSALGRRM